MFCLIYLYLRLRDVSVSTTVTSRRRALKCAKAIPQVFQNSLYKHYDVTHIFRKRGNHRYFGIRTNGCKNTWLQASVAKKLRTCGLLGYYEASSGNFSPTFRDNLLVPSSGFRYPILLDSWTPCIITQNNVVLGQKNFPPLMLGLSLSYSHS